MAPNDLTLDELYKATKRIRLHLPRDVQIKHLPREMAIRARYGRCAYHMQAERKPLEYAHEAAHFLLEELRYYDTKVERLLTAFPDHHQGSPPEETSRGHRHHHDRWVWLNDRPIGPLSRPDLRMPMYKLVASLVTRTFRDGAMKRSREVSLQWSPEAHIGQCAAFDTWNLCAPGGHLPYRTFRHAGTGSEYIKSPGLDREELKLEDSLEHNQGALYFDRRDRKRKEWPYIWEVNP